MPQGPSSPNKPADGAASAGPPLWRPPGVLGRLFGLPPQIPPRSTSRGNDAEGRSEAGRGESENAGSADAATDVAAKRRIEKQIRDALGDKVRSVEVRVTGRNVLVVAKPNRFWQKRGIRRTLESLPGLDGYRARIDVAD